MNAKIQIKTIKPVDAQLMLDNLMEGQRHKRDSHVSRLAADMKEGRWSLSPDAILFVKGKLANGQHRLSAVVESNMAQEFIVMESADDQLYKVLDSGIKRTVGDIIGLSNSNQLAAIVNTVVQYDKGKLTQSGCKPEVAVTRGDLVEYALKHQEELQEQMRVVKAFYDQKRIWRPSQAGALLHLASRRHKNKAMEFVEAVYMGSTRDDAAHDYRERLIKNAASKAKLPSQYLFALAIKSFNSFIQGTRSGVLRMSEGEDFPRVR